MVTALCVPCTNDSYCSVMVRLLRFRRTREVSDICEHIVSVLPISSQVAIEVVFFPLQAM